MSKGYTGSHKSGNNALKIFLYIFFGYFVLIFFINLISSDNGSSTEKLADGFTIEAYNVKMNVGIDNKIDVMETIVTNFTKYDKHGIYKFTPLWLEYTGKDGNTISRKAKISDYRAIGDPYSLDTVKKKARIKIGSADQYVGYGRKTYTIAYTYDMGKDPFKNFDELIFHAYGDYWGTEIKNASIEINMPKNIEGYNVNFFTDKYRKNNITELVNYKVVGNTLYAELNTYGNKECSYEDIEICNYLFNNVNNNSNRYPLNTALTVDIELPEGYFEGGSWNYGWGSFIISMIIFGLTGFTIYKWVKYGKDFEKKTRTVEFYPPDNLNAAEIGYIYNNRQASKKLTIALIVQLASKGYIKIDDLKNKEKDIKVTNLVMNRPKMPKDMSKSMPKDAVVAKKIKDIDDGLQKNEATMMKYLFKSNDIKIVENNIDKFLEVKDDLINKGYIKILDDKDKESIYNQSVEDYNNELRKYNETISVKSSLTPLEEIVYNRLFENKNDIIISSHRTLYKAFDDVSEVLESTFNNKVHDEQSSKQIKGSIIRNIIILLLSIISYRYVEDLDPSWRILYILSFGCIFINLFFTLFMNRKTEYGELISARVKGFRHFLETVEKPRLEALVAENPNYFYDILPYTYAMNISKKWIKKFENIPIPKYDMGSFDYASDAFYHSFYRSIYYPTPVHTSSSSSRGCSSCGGGCSSCGGGCSSCGGGGSW